MLAPGRRVSVGIGAGVFVLLLLLGGGAPGGATTPGSDGRPAAAATVLDAVPPAEGQELYLQNCASCHGADGRGVPPYGPSLEDAGPASHDFYLRTGRMPLSAPGEPQYRQEPIFTSEQIEAIVAYASQFGEGPGIPQVTTAGADLAKGWSLYTANCSACHGPSGAGGAVGIGVFAPSLHETGTVQIAEAMLVGPGTMPAFGFDEEQLSAITAYVEYIRDAPSPGGVGLGGLGPVPEGFVAIVVGLLLLVVAAKWIAGRRPA